ncbi:ATP-binding protein [Flavobacterium sp. MDT1-60]|uniref:sensor histidine kinase n=1 Tax=Flavobacterium sp. MDT1-60 TaxID=1979344 RepID=UPI001CE0F131
MSDNGIGIEKGDLDAILNPFFRSNSTDHPEIKGTGLGLSIVKRTTELLGIKFKIESEIEVGTSVILSFNENMKTLS